jgi:hypothetical protein
MADRYTRSINVCCMISVSLSLSLSLSLTHTHTHTHTHTRRIEREDAESVQNALRRLGIMARAQGLSQRWKKSVCAHAEADAVCAQGWSRQTVVALLPSCLLPLSSKDCAIRTFPLRSCQAMESLSP